MTLFMSVGGVDLGNTTVRLEGGIASLSTWADGNTATAGVEVDDPTGALTFIDLQQFIVVESACTAAPRCFTGYIYNIRTKRGPFRNAAGRVWVFDVADLNFLLRLRVLRGASAKRPRETIDARVAWLLGSAGMTGVVFDHGMVASRGASMIDEADYRHQYHADVWADISTGWIFYVYFDVATGQPSMFFDDPTAVTNTSTLTISNVLSDVVAAPTTCFAPNEDSELLGAGEDIYDGVDYTYIGDANIYRQRAATYSAFGLHRDGTVVSSRVGKLATAETQAASFLELHSGQIDTITCVVQLPASKVNLIDAGMRISVRFSHLPGYTSFTYTRVTSRTLTLAAGTNEYYDVQLELSMKGIGQLSGGAPGDFPHIGCSGIPAIVHSETAGHSGTSSTWSFTPTAGNVLVMVAFKRDGWPAATAPSGWTMLDQNGATGANSDGIAVAAKVSDGTETNSGGWGTSLPTGEYVIELSGADVANYVTAHSEPLTTATLLTGPAVTPNAGNPVIVFGVFTLPEDGALGLTTGTGWTLLNNNSNGGSHPHALINYKTAVSASGSYAPTANNPSAFGGHNWDFFTFALWCSEASNPPGPATRFGPVTPIETPDGATYTFTLPAGKEFADRSLEVFVDRLDQTAAVTSYDGVARTFTLAFAPWGTDVIEVYGQGR